MCDMVAFSLLGARRGMSTVFYGSIVALVTPMDTQGNVDYLALKKLVQWHLSQNSDGLVVLGTTGESVTLTWDEQRKIVELVLTEVDGKIPVIAGSGSNCTRQTIEKTQAMQAMGVDGVLVVTPYYNKPTQAGLVAHYRAVSQSTTLPIILYNVPGRTACDLLPETVAEIAQCDNVVGIKEATGKVERVQLLRSLITRADFCLLSGDDETVLDFLLAGGDGVISVSANVIPKLMHDLCLAVREGDVIMATQLFTQSEWLHQRLFVEPNPIPVKWALQQMGKIQGGIRLPLLPLSLAKQAAVVAALEQVEIFL